MIKSDFWVSKTLTRVSRDSRLLFIGLWNFADDYGVLQDSNRRILGDIFPYDDKVTEKEIDKWKTELVDENLLIQIEHQGHSYLYIRSWDEHQKVAHPGKETLSKEVINESLMRVSRGSHSYIERGVGVEREREREVITSNEVSSTKSGEEIQNVSLGENSNSPTPVPRPPSQGYGNVELNELLDLLKEKLGLDDFKETAIWQRRWGQNLLSLMKKVTPHEFGRRLEVILADEFKRKNCNKLEYIHREIKAFIEPKSNYLQV